MITCRGRVLREASARARNTTCNRMEFQAVIEALQTLPASSKVTLYSDSRILIKTLTVLLPEWKALGGTKKNGRLPPQWDQVQMLDKLNQEHLISWKWIKAHSGIPFNERCDELCMQARR